MDTTFDAIIIGTGIIGSATAFELAKLGYKVLSVDRNAQIGHGSTSSSCAAIRMHYSTFIGTATAWEGYHYWANWADHLGLPSNATLATYQEYGCLVMKTPANGQLVKHTQMSHQLGIPTQDWSRQDILDRLPIYALDSYAPAKLMSDEAFGEPNGKQLEGGVFWPNAGYVNDPALAAQNLAKAATLNGAQTLLKATVTEILQEAGQVKGVKLASGESLFAPIVVNVAGPGSNIINAMAGVLDDMSIQTKALKQEVVYLPSPDGFDFERDGVIVSDSDIDIYCRPDAGNNIMLGTQEPPCDAKVWVDDELDWDDNFSDQWTTQALRYAQRVPTIGIPSRMQGIVSLYDVSTDWIPVYDKSSLGGFYMTCGTSGNQFKNAPLVGKIMAGIIDHCEAGHNQDAEPLQFRLPYIDQVIDTSFYSRKRAVNQESSFSVVG